MQNATCSEIHMEVLLPVLQVYSTWNLFHSMFTGIADDGLNVPPSGCHLKKDSMHKEDRALRLVRNDMRLTISICILPETLFSMCFACTLYSLVLIKRILEYLGIKGDQFFSDLRSFFGSRFTYKLV
jgi:hypothetical protein